ncbi:hypothetical protein TSAR_008187 [Trichomalopsis sarcophagae]|uniref:Uncharacterized protein n=1 Tax=Trichomalopsis sarcophagae TaxID=543379 RepID=A0A232EG84_9HYME|nr:hypothetical protein TSAR_008187 [Trichomalopsis sarcophagae]
MNIGNLWICTIDQRGASDPLDALQAKWLEPRVQGSGLPDLVSRHKSRPLSTIPELLAVELPDSTILRVRLTDCTFKIPDGLTLFGQTTEHKSEADYAGKHY